MRSQELRLKPAIFLPQISRLYPRDLQPLTVKGRIAIILHDLDNDGRVALYVVAPAAADDGGALRCYTGHPVVSKLRDCYLAADKISWDGMTLRRDIGWRAIARYSEPG